MDTSHHENERREQAQEAHQYGDGRTGIGQNFADFLDFERVVQDLRGKKSRTKLTENSRKQVHARADTRARSLSEESIKRPTKHRTQETHPLPPQPAISL
jgi:hypothetical protein